MQDQRFPRGMNGNRITRRSLLKASGKAGVGAAGLALVGCGGGDRDPPATQAAQAEPELPAEPQAIEQSTGREEPSEVVEPVTPPAEPVVEPRSVAPLTLSEYVVIQLDVANRANETFIRFGANAPFLDDADFAEFEQAFIDFRDKVGTIEPPLEAAELHVRYLAALDALVAGFAQAIRGGDPQDLIDGIGLFVEASAELSRLEQVVLAGLDDDPRATYLIARIDTRLAAEDAVQFIGTFFERLATISGPGDFDVLVRSLDDLAVLMEDIRAQLAALTPPPEAEGLHSRTLVTYTDETQLIEELADLANELALIDDADEDGAFALVADLLAVSARAADVNTELSLIGIDENDLVIAVLSGREYVPKREPSALARSVNLCPSFEAPFAGIMAHMFVAEELGFFEEEGIRQEITYQSACANLLAAGATDIALLDLPEVLNALNAGREFKAIFQPWYKVIFGVFVPEDSPIQSWNADDLRGRTIGVTEFAGGEVPIVRALLAQIGLTEGEDVELLPTSSLPGFRPTVDAFADGRIVAFGGGRHDVFAVELGGLRMRDITPPNVQAIFASETLAVRAADLEDAERRDRIVRYVRGYNKGITFLQASVEAAAEIGLQVAPRSGSLQETIDLLNLFFIGIDPAGHRATPPPGTQFGHVPIDGWNDFQLLLLAGRTGTAVDPLAFATPIDVTRVIDNSLIDEVNDFDKEAIRQQARDYVLS